MRGTAATDHRDDLRTRVPALFFFFLGGVVGELLCLVLVLACSVAREPVQISWFRLEQVSERSEPGL